jgi:hypothetical protein
MAAAKSQATAGSRGGGIGKWGGGAWRRAKSLAAAKIWRK